ncbi:DnaT-like ssDNA-binding domain-containing protein [Neptunicella sp. SCSIO 80796]|uniref:DnaT-like ssDNA-binding domain-containing protein n=1 Tax=Neptunicella plasticusilytica TaxID=3117012 RepID=UPI003A4E1661
MLNQSELNALKQPVSNEARVLYFMALRINVDEKSGTTSPLNYNQLKDLLNGKTEIISLGRQINALIKELVDIGLVNYTEQQQENHSLNGKQLLLPLIATQNNDYQNLHMQWQSMRADWQPNSMLFNQLASLVGIIEKAYSDDELGEFIAYWLTRPESNFTLFQWTQKFVQHLKKKRLAYGNKPQKRVGNQLVNSKAAVNADDNAKRLVEKYSAKHQK